MQLRPQYAAAARSFKNSNSVLVPNNHGPCLRLTRRAIERSGGVFSPSNPFYTAQSTNSVTEGAFRIFLERDSVVMIGNDKTQVTIKLHRRVQCEKQQDLWHRTARYPYKEA